MGALTSRAYRFRARPWDIEGAGTVCAGCPAQCNVELTVRDERVLRVLARDHAEVDDGWLCDKGRFSYQADPLRRADHHPAGARGRRAAAGELGEGDRGGGRRAEEGGRPRGRAGRRHDDQRGGLPPPAAAARRPRRLAPERPHRRRAAARRAARAGRPEAAGHGAGPRVRAHRAADRLRPDRRGAGLGPAHPQGRAPARAPRSSSPPRARPRWTRSRRRRCASRPAAARASWSRSTRR